MGNLEEELKNVYKMKEEKYFFERKVFSKNYKFKFSIDKELLDTITDFKKSGKVLDVDVGDNGTSLKLTELGFDVSCVGISKICIKALQEEVKRRLSYCNEKKIKLVNVTFSLRSNFCLAKGN